MLSWRNVICLIPHSSRGNPTRHGNISIRMLVNGHRYRGYSERTSRFQLPCIRYAKASPKLRLASHQQRTLSLASLPTILLPPVAFFGLLVALWIYKCMMMVLFQDKIIYMPYIPPFSRSEEIGIYQAQCGPVSWESKHIKSLDGTNLAICVGKVSGNETQTRQVILCYFQGNASSLPPRLPMLSSVLRNIEAARKDPSIQYVLVALSYRGYWTSTGRASQRGIELDAQALLTWVETEFGTDTKVILWGQSIGAGVASTATATYLLRNDQKLHIQGLILETPFSNIRSMLSAMYPQKWLPYGYLWPFLWTFGGAPGGQRWSFAWGVTWEAWFLQWFESIRAYQIR